MRTGTLDLGLVPSVAVLIIAIAATPACSIRPLHGSQATKVIIRVDVTCVLVVVAGGDNPSVHGKIPIKDWAASNRIVGGHAIHAVLPAFLLSVTEQVGDRLAEGIVGYARYQIAGGRGHLR